MARPPQAKPLPEAEPEAKGIYQQRRGYWYRYSFGNRQHFVNLRTTSYAEAIEKKKTLIASGALTSPEVVKAVWEKAVNRYLDEKIAKGEIRAVHRSKVKSALMVFQDFAKVKTPAAVSPKHLQRFYTLRRKKSEAGARTSVNTVQAFLNHLGLLTTRVKFVRHARPEARNVHASMATINSWIDGCEDPDLKFVLFCLGNLGMRAGEVRHARREWFDKDFINIPAKQPYRLKNGTMAEWRTKDNEARQVPLPAKMRDFLSHYLEGKKGLVIRSKTSKDGTWDFRLPLQRKMAEVGRPEFFPHAFRHSWITTMMNGGKTIQQVSAWSGDSIMTLERNYWKKQAAAGDTDDLIEGKAAKTFTEEFGEALANGEVRKILKSVLNETKEEIIVELCARIQSSPEKITVQEVEEVVDNIYGELITDEKLLAKLRKEIANIPLEEDTDYQNSLMTPEELEAHYKEIEEYENRTS